MFLLLLTYARPLPEVEALLPAHMSWLETHYAAGTFAASGRRVPRTGGAILLRVPDRTAAEALAATDPFVTGQVADYEIIEIAFSRASSGFEGLLQP